MPTMAEMVEAHLVNVKREIANLQERKVAIDAEIAKLEEYLKEGSTTLEAEKSPQSVPATPESPLFNPVSLGG